MADTLEEKLLQAVKFGRSEEVKEILTSGKYIRKYAALRKAIKNGNQEIATILITAGAYVDRNILSSLAGIGWKDAVRAVLDNIHDMKFRFNFALWRVAYNGHAEIVEMLLAAGANVRETSDRAIRGAVKANRVQIMETLASYYKIKELEVLQSELRSLLLAYVIALQKSRGSYTKAALREPRPDI